MSLPVSEATPVPSDESGNQENLDFTSTLRKRRVEVPTVLQMEVTECGAASLAMILAHYGRWETLETLRLACGVSRDGSNAKNVVKAARSFGMEAKGLSIPLHRLPYQEFPIIAFWNFNHFLVIEGTSKKGVHVNDPAKGRVVIPWDEADTAFTGLILRMAPGPTFERAGSAPSTVSSLRWRLKGSGAGISYLLVAGLAMSVPMLLGPMALQAFVQQFLIGGLREWAYIAAGLMAMSLFLSVWIAIWQTNVSRRLTQSMTSMETRVLMTRALRLPMSFYAQRYPHEVAGRLHLVDQISRIVTSTVVPSVLGLVTSAAVAFALFSVAWQLAVIAFAAAGALVLSMRAAKTARANQAAQLGQAGAATSGSIGYWLQSIETVKATGAEDTALRMILGHIARVAALGNNVQLTSALIGILPSIVGGIAMASVVGVGGLLVERGDITIGSYVGVLSLLPIFFRPLGIWSSAIDTLQQARSWLARLDDLLEQPEDSVGTAEPAGGGVLEMRDVHFEYAPGARPAVSSLSLRVEPGRRVALVGASGSGKSTAARIAVGLLTATKGDVLLDGVPVADCSASIRARSLGYVEQEIVLFPGTIRDNITLFDDTVDTADIKAAAKAAAIDVEIESRSGAYDAMLSAGGRNLSGGQRQRLEIARVMLRKPGIVVLDEATSALDPLAEESVMQALLASGCGLLIIAHRLSTVRDCDEIIVMEHGNVVERGTHTELLAANGHYAELVGSA